MSEPRVTAYGAIFRGAHFDETRFDELRVQAESQHAQTLAEVQMLPAAGVLLRAFLPGDDAGAAHGEVVTQVSALLFHAYRYWLHGRHVYRLNEDAVRAMLASGDPVAVELPQAAGYVQLPRNIIWGRVSDDAAPEPVDGFFWSTPDSAAAGPLELLLALGVRRIRPGLSLVDVSLASPRELAQWAVADARPGGVDFENVLPGGELQGYHALTTRAEVLKLAALCFGAIARLSNGARTHVVDDETIHELDG